MKFGDNSVGSGDIRRNWRRENGGGFDQNILYTYMTWRQAAEKT